MIEIRSLTKTYTKDGEKLVVLDSIDLDIAKGDFVMVLGESGSGKTTLLNILGAIDKADSGRIVIQDFGDILSMSDKRLADYRNRVVGHIFQTFNLKKIYTAYANVKVPLVFSPAYATPSARDERGRIMRALERVGLADRAQYRPPQLSEGQCQRVAIARAIVNEPEILLADEPTGNLDPKTARKIMDLLMSLNRDDNTTLLMVTHDVSMLEYAQKTVNLEGGKIVVKEK
jgi:putative ABC transport system ATP-binding protein